jgi:hypothetical protein
MRSSAEDVVKLLKKWQKHGIWIFAIARLDGRDEHRFWAKIGNVSKDEVWLAGESAMLSLRLDDDKCEYSEVLKPPPDVRIRSKDFDCCLMIRSPKISALLVAHKPQVRPA